MTVDVLLDTNVLVYAFDKAGQHGHKGKRAVALIAETNFGTSGQILQEFFVVVTRKFRQPETFDRAVLQVEALSRLPCVPVDAHLVISAMAISRRFKISYWDAAVIAAAEELGAPTVYTEDLNHEQKYGAVTVINPFK
jgi:predicted nucleic acid-binding protein